MDETTPQPLASLSAARRERERRKGISGLLAIGGAILVFYVVQQDRSTLGNFIGGIALFTALAGALDWLDQRQQIRFLDRRLRDLERVPEDRETANRR